MMQQQRSMGVKDKASTDTQEHNKRFKPYHEVATQLVDDAPLRSSNLQRNQAVSHGNGHHGPHFVSPHQASLPFVLAPQQLVGSLTHNLYLLVSFAQSEGFHSMVRQGPGQEQGRGLMNPSGQLQLQNAMNRTRHSYWHLAARDPSLARILLETMAAARALPSHTSSGTPSGNMTLANDLAPMNATLAPLSSTGSLVHSTHLEASSSRALPFCLSSAPDAASLSPFQIFLRLHMEAFAATLEDTLNHTRGRNKKIRVHQVGLRCRHCAPAPAVQRIKGSVYFPSSILGFYQAAQNMSSTHLQCGACSEMPESIKQVFAQLLATKTPGSSSVGGRAYWGLCVQEMGDLVDTDSGVFARYSVPPGARLLTSSEQPHYQTK